MLGFLKSGQGIFDRKKANIHYYLNITNWRICMLIVVLEGAQVLPAHAAICFLPDCAEKVLEFQGGDDETAKACRESGYELYSNLVCSEFSKIEYCPSNPNYIKCNDRKWCIENGYNVPPDTCNIPKYPDEKCPNNQPLYKSCVIDYERALVCGRRC